MEAVRIIKEMRCKTNGRYPKIAIWENVPGAFSSNNGEDFRTVLEELCKIKGSGTSVPRPPKRRGKPAWNDAGLILGDGFSIAWRVLDAQFWGVPQRRRRIFLVADFGGQCAGEILFEREGLSRSFAESRESWKGITHSLAYRPSTRVWDARGNGDGNIAPTITGDHNNRVTDYTTLCVRERCGKEGGGKGALIQENKSGIISCNNDQFLVITGADLYNQALTEEVSMTLCAGRGECQKVPCLVFAKTDPSCGETLAMATQQGGAEIGIDLCPAITAAAGNERKQSTCYLLCTRPFFV
jgi:DNA (cytosine-5)-methyltransferase 1